MIPLLTMSYHFPLVSVIIPVYNAEDFICQTLDSVLSQTYNNIEVLVIDDGSQDRSAEIVKAVALRDPRVILLQQSNAGVAAARNLAIQKSSGEYIAPIDADDIWYPQKLEKQVQCMLQTEPTVGLVYAWSVDIDEKGLVTRKCQASNLEGEVYIPLVYANFLGNASSPLIRRTCLEQVGGYNCRLKEQNAQGCEDWDLYLRIAEYYQFRVVPEFLIGYRQVSGSMSRNHISMEKSFYLLMEDVQQRHPEIFHNIYQWSSSNFSYYLAQRSTIGGDHWNTILYLYKASRLDFLFFLHPGVHWRFIKSLLKLVAEPITSLIWQDHGSWLQFRKRFLFSYQVCSISELHRREIINSQRFLRKQYCSLVLQRWVQVAKKCQVSSQVANLKTYC